MNESKISIKDMFKEEADAISDKLMRLDDFKGKSFSLRARVGLNMAIDSFLDVNNEKLDTPEFRNGKLVNESMALLMAWIDRNGLDETYIFLMSALNWYLLELEAQQRKE